MAIRGLSAALLALSATPAWAGPFGLQAGMPLSRMNTILEQEPGIYEIIVPEPHPQLAAYSALVSPTRGLCSVKAFGFPLSDDSHGTRVRSLVEEIAAPIAARYGAGTTEDALNSGSVWKEPRHWAMGIAKGDRTYARYWKTPADPEISMIKLKVKAIRSGGATYVELDYDFKRSDSCIDEIEAGNGAAR